MWGMRDCRLVAVVGHLGLKNYVSYQTLDWLIISLFPGRVYPQLGGDPML
jgi:hypothetical protein